MGYFKRLIVEHQIVNEMLCVQNELIKRLKMAKGVNVVHLDNLLSFWRDFLEQEHMSWEEEVAFAVFRKINHPLLDKMLGEHERLKSYLLNLEETMKLLRKGRPHSGREFTKWGEEFAETVAEHLSKENSVFKELAVNSGEKVENVEYPVPEGIRQEKLMRLFSVAEKLCQEYLGKPASLPIFQEETNEEPMEEEVYKEKAITNHSIEPIADPFEKTISNGEETENGYSLYP
ncbi:MAG TPA: hypothetical protein DDW93_05290 [Firmicutes bacterium]|jgi:hemerythrin-like domain-containing protein|nr:hypothetical protein [Bacillota bacterium]HBK68018.1 hypothetical protein [Bacillota bacterium]HBT16648.1 hypothetical protein [Bacillota bacterium]